MPIHPQNQPGNGKKKEAPEPSTAFALNPAFREGIGNASKGTGGIGNPGYVNLNLLLQRALASPTGEAEIYATHRHPPNAYQHADRINPFENHSDFGKAFQACYRSLVTQMQNDPSLSGLTRKTPWTMEDRVLWDERMLYHTGQGMRAHPILSTWRNPTCYVNHYSAATMDDRMVCHHMAITSGLLMQRVENQLRAASTDYYGAPTTYFRCSVIEVDGNHKPASHALAISSKTGLALGNTREIYRPNVPADMSGNILQCLSGIPYFKPSKPKAVYFYAAAGHALVPHNPEQLYASWSNRHATPESPCTADFIKDSAQPEKTLEALAAANRQIQSNRQQSIKQSVQRAMETYQWQDVLTLNDNPSRMNQDEVDALLKKLRSNLLAHEVHIINQPGTAQDAIECDGVRYKTSFMNHVRNFSAKLF